MHYTKMHGAGNSFVITENLHGELQSGDLSVLALRLCDPETGVGADGMIVLIPAGKDADFGMLFYNSDSSLGEMCGNGARCAARYGFEHGLASDPGCIRIQATAGVVTGRKISNGYDILSHSRPYPSFPIVWAVPSNTQHLNKILGKNDIVKVDGFQKQRGYLEGSEGSDSAANTCDEEFVVTMAEGKLNELVHIGFDGLHPALHGGNGVALSLQSNTLAPYCSKATVGQTGSSATMCASKVAAKDENLAGLQIRYSLRGIFSVVHHLIFSTWDKYY